MSREFGFIKDLKKDVNVCKVGFRVLDLWTVTASNGRQHLELIICDGKGDRAHAITRQADFQRLKSSIEENQTYVLHNCLMFDNDVLFKPVDYPFKLVFGAGTKVTRSDKLTDIPSHEFRFKSFKEIGEGVFKDDVLYEIIGVIHEIGKTTVIGDGKKPCTNIVLRDESGNLVDVTLWDKYSVQLMTFLAERKDRGSVILILTHAQCKLADNGKPNLCNNWSVSKLLINLKHPVVEAFRASLQAQGHRFDQSLCQVSSSSQRVNYDEFSNLSGVKSIAEFRDFDKDTYCITVAKSLKFNPNRYGWYYETCTKCTKASRSGGASYKCSCGEEVEVPLTRYKVVVIMEYRDHKAEFLFWDKECFQILGVAADTLRKTMQQVGEDDPHIYPEVLDKLLKIEFALRVKYQLGAEG
ncbi:replication protein A 70 kDa DNA-binding subunit A-like [Medicago truncatula]|uniref:replication protein A 70 kDa DNA-binding subunit A-like n=1 Tax=Medicago truncatula TaxID=3880 RepID=UPI001967D6F6|nr:replication protein A 70 kDa DNA-binding subunit A-like [Medicago truncatula]